jgi:programmed cell death 6-interacting protein
VKESLEKQEHLIAAIQTNSDEFFGSKQGGADGVMSRRDQVMRQLAEGYDAFVDLQSNTSEGRKFYNDLTQLLLAFQNKVSDFCFARKTEKEELLKDVTRDASSVGTSAQAPPRPPPPTNIPPASAPTYSSQPAQNPQMQQPPQFQQPGNLPYPTSYPNTMPMPMPYQQQPMPYQFTPMPAGYNPYATYAPVQPQQQQNYPYPVQPMGYPPYYAQQQQPPPPQ